MRKPNIFSTFMFFVVFALGLTIDYFLTNSQITTWSGLVGLAVSFAAASVVSYSIKVAEQWERAIVLRLGKFQFQRGPGLFFIIPIIDSVPFWIDTRVMTTSITAEKTLTKDTVPVNVDAVLFWKVVDPKMAALNVADFEEALGWASKTALRDVIGKTQLSDMLEGRDKLGKDLLRIIDDRTEPWGVKVISVEVKDVLIPAGLENAMSMQAQAERERQARVILGDSEKQVAEKFGDAAKTYIENPVAMHLRAMNMLYEGLKQNSTIVVVPSSAVESMELGNYTGIVALSRELEQERKSKAGANRVEAKTKEELLSESIARLESEGGLHH